MKFSESQRIDLSEPPLSETAAVNSANPVILFKKLLSASVRPGGESVPGCGMSFQRL